MGAGVTSPFVTWSTEAEANAAKKITVTVRIDFIIPPVAGLPDFNRIRLAKVVRDAAAKWHGFFMCYEFVLNVDFRIVDGRGAVRADALDVVVREGFPYGQTRSSGSDDKTHWMSDDPADTVTPLRGDDDTFSYVGLERNLLSHELGHMIGLHEGYTETRSGTTYWGFGQPAPTAPTPGHEPDVMQTPALPVSPKTIARAVRRHYGPSFEKNMLCPIGLKVGPSTLDLLLAAVEDVTLDATAPRYAPPTDDPSATAEPAVFTGTFHAKGDYLTRFPGLPWSASGTLDLPVTFSVDFAQTPIALNVSLPFWQLSQTLQWDATTGLPYALGPLLIHSDGAVLDSAQLWPGPPLQPEFYEPPPATA